jgi:hypothetical protein
MPAAEKREMVLREKGKNIPFTFPPSSSPLLTADSFIKVKRENYAACG